MVGKLEAMEDVVGFTPTRIVENNLSLIMSLINTLSPPPPFFFPFHYHTFRLAAQRPKGQGNKGEFEYFYLIS